jgi:hypothetical protein
MTIIPDEEEGRKKKGKKTLVDSLLIKVFNIPVLV